ncbi:MAG: cation:proton antiporter [Chloroflexota bacterium]|nr:cation:proton antiporter [Chloroflexota bacterium]
MEDVGLILDLVLALGVALVGGSVAQRLGQPALLGYVVAGFLIGPNTPGPHANVERVELLANLGVAFLMFALGVEFSFNELRRMQRIALVTGGIQIPLTLVLGTLSGIAIGWSLPAALLLGGAFAISSSIVALKLLLGRGEGTSPQSRAVLSLSVVQDLSLVPMLAIVPVLSGDTASLATDLARSLLTAIVALVAVIVLGTRVVPPILYVVARLESRELFLLTVVVIALGTAVASETAGLSLALGAFLAGLVVSESEFDSHVLSEIIPLRDLFSTLFFVALGMLIEPAFLIENIGTVLALVAVLILGKLLITGGAFLAAGLDHRTTTLSALAMAQIGEFSFVLAGVGVAEGVIDRRQYGLILEVALVSILIAPSLLRLGPTLVSVAARLPGVAGQEAAQAGPEAEPTSLSRHVVICGYGRVGSEVGEALMRRGLRFVVIEINPAIVRGLRERGIQAFYGDAASEPLLLRAGIERARTLAVTSADLMIAQSAARTARRLNPSIDVVTRAAAGDEVEILRQAGVNEVVQPEFEAGLEFVRHVLRRQGVSAREATMMLTRRRSAFYGLIGEPGRPSEDER